MAEYVVTWVDASGGGDLVDVWRFKPGFRIEWGGQTVRTAIAEMDGLTHMAAADQMRLSTSDDDPADEADKPLRDAFTMWALKRLEAQLTAGELPPSDHLRVTHVAEVVTMAGLKECGYQQRDGRDLYCTCAGQKDETVIGTINGRRAAPTSTPTCAGCNLPSTAWLCSHFIHPQVGGVRTFGGYSRSIVNAMCDRGHDDRVMQAPTLCRPGGHDCWQRVVESTPFHVSMRVGPTTVAEALDYLDIVWMQAFGQGHLLGGVSTVRHVGLAMDCQSREEFVTRVGEAADILATMRVPEVPDTPADQRPKGSLNELKTWLAYSLQGDPAAARVVDDAVGRLRQLVGIRAASTHTGSDAERRAVAAYAALGIEYPPDWSTAWETIRREMAHALNVIREQVRTLVP